MPGSDSDADSLDNIRRYTQTFYHPARDLRDRIGVDSERVQGIDGRRSWTSVMPVIVGRSTNAPTIMIAEKIISAHRRAALSSRPWASAARTARSAGRRATPPA